MKITLKKFLVGALLIGAVVAGGWYSGYVFTHVREAKAAYIPIVAMSGFYTPTLTGVSNVDSSTAYDAQWIRIDNVVTVFGVVDVNTTAAASTELGISLPIPSNIQGVEGAVGTAASPGASQSGGVQGDAVNDRAQMVYNAVSGSNETMMYNIMYTLIP